MTLTFSIILILILFFLIYRRIIVPKVVKKPVEFSSNHSANDYPTPVYLDDHLNVMEDKLVEVVNSVDEYFESSEIYLNSKLSADLLGSLLKQNPRIIGAAIRFKYGISFRDYINSRRIQYIEETFIQNKDFHKYSLDYIGEKAGFGTRQGFYIAFKKLKNTTPKEYFNQLLNS